MSPDETIVALKAAMATVQPMLHPNVFGISVFTPGGLAMTLTTCDSSVEYFKALREHASKNIPAYDTPGVHTDSHGFVKIVHPGGYSVATIDTNAITIGELQLVIAVMREKGRGRK